MNSLSGWLNVHKYELLSDRRSGMCKIRDVDNGSKKLLKILDVSELNSKVVAEVVSTMNRVNNVNIDGLMKYKVIERDENCLYRIMREYKTHLDVINPLKYFEENGVFEVLNGILNILNGLNEAGTIHSDLKPSNIFLNDENEVILSDYCNNLLFKGREGMKNDGIRKDLCFVCYDELLGKELDILSDIWNFGLIFYYIKSGKYPFVGKNMLETMNNIRDVKYNALECENGDKLNSFLRKILVKEKKDRLKLNDVLSELKKLNEAELPVIPFEEENINIDEELKNRIDLVIKKCKTVNGNELSISWYYMKDEGMKYLYSKLDRMNNVTKIAIQSNDLTSIGLNTFSECLKFFPNLEELWLSFNPFGNNSLKIFSENLHFIPKLKKLELSSCKLGDEAMKYLCSHFKDIPNLEGLSLFDNKIGDKGIEYLCENINEIQKLQILDLNDNEIGDIGGEILINNLHKCKELKNLWLYNNKISNYDDFKRRIKENHPNKSLEID